MLDLGRIQDFIASNARLLDRRRVELAVGAGDPEATLAVLAGYRNADGGFGWALEPDSRAPVSQPVAALHAFEVFEEVAPSTSPLAVGLLDWLDGIAVDDGALPFALPGGATAGSAPMWGTSDTQSPSLHMTCVVLSIAHRVARHDPEVAAHPWLRRATDWAMREIAGLDGPSDAIEFRYVLQLLDALDARDELKRLGAHLPPNGTIAVTGGKPDEAMRPLDFSPEPDRPIRDLLDPQAIEADLARLEAEQHDDGGWDVDWKHWSPAGGLEWRGWATVRAVRILRAHGRL
ncbi:MAG TPA: hypothetical protein VGU26_04360 [Gaiellaceae bacterium]|nr:hypothetical protein [Gaiellaceae bacterium]